jgi:hypothetical protein
MKTRSGWKQPECFAEILLEETTKPNADKKKSEA